MPSPASKLTAEHCAALIVGGLVGCTRGEGDVYIRGGLTGGRFMIADGNGDLQRAGHIVEQVKRELERGISRTLLALTDAFRPEHPF